MFRILLATAVLCLIKVESPAYVRAEAAEFKCSCPKTGGACCARHKRRNCGKSQLIEKNGAARAWRSASGGQVPPFVASEARETEQ